MASQAIVHLIGHLGRDPEMRQTGSSEVCNFSMATSRKRGGEETTTWWRVAVWGKQGENCERYLSKGSLVSVVGEVYQGEYQGNDGETRTSLEVNANTVTFLGGKGDSSGSGSRSSSSSPRNEAPPHIDEDMPF